MKVFTSKTTKDTALLAKTIAKELKGGDCLGLIGNLGTGKTTLTQSIGKALGIKQAMSSPTFVLMKIYPVNKKGINQLCHIDAYRLTSMADLEAIGAKDYIGDPKTVTIIEWADKVVKLLPVSSKIIKISHNNGTRIFELP